MLGGKCFVLVLHHDQRLLRFVCLLAGLVLDAEVIENLFVLDEFMHLRNGVNVVPVKHEDSLITIVTRILGRLLGGEGATKLSGLVSLGSDIVFFAAWDDSFWMGAVDLVCCRVLVRNGTVDCARELHLFHMLLAYFEFVLGLLQDVQRRLGLVVLNKHVHGALVELWEGACEVVAPLEREGADALLLQTTKYFRFTQMPGRISVILILVLHY